MNPFYFYHFSLIVAFSIRVAAADAMADPPPKAASLSLNEVTQAVLANSPAIKAALKRWNAAKARAPQAAAWEDLKISAQSRLARFVNVAPNSFTDQMLTVEQMIPVAGKNLSRARIAAAEALSALEDVRRQKLDAISKSREAYYQLENAYAQLELNHKSFASLKQIAEISRSQYEVGKQSATDILVAESEASKLHENEHDLLRGISEAQSQLNVLMNLDAFAPLGKPLPSSASPTDLPLARLRSLMLVTRPEIRMAKAKVQGEMARLQLAHRDAWPEVAVQVTAQRYNASQAMSEVGAGVSVTVPWLNRTKYSAEAFEAGENLGAAQQDLAKAQTEATGLLRDQLQKIETLSHHVELFRDDLLPKASQAFEATQLGYETGKTGFLEWISAQRTLRDIQSMARQHLKDYQIAVAQLEAVIGTELRTTESRTSQQLKSETR